MTYTAIDFETASPERFACSVAIVSVRDGLFVDSYYTLICPPDNIILPNFTAIHGITPEDTQNAPEFPEIFDEIKSRLAGKVVVAHNESFDRGVLRKHAEFYGMDTTGLNLNEPWQCTLKLYRKKGFNPCTLDALAEKHGIPLKHHDALSDARACAELYGIYLNQGFMK